MPFRKKWTRVKRFLCTFNMSQQSGRGTIWHTRIKIYIKMSYEACITFSDISPSCWRRPFRVQFLVTNTKECLWPVWVKKNNASNAQRKIRGCQSFVSSIFFYLNITWFPSKTFLLRRKKAPKFKTQRKGILTVCLLTCGWWRQS